MAKSFTKKNSSPNYYYPCAPKTQFNIPDAYIKSDEEKDIVSLFMRMCDSKNPSVETLLINLILSKKLPLDPKHFLSGVYQTNLHLQSKEYRLVDMCLLQTKCVIFFN